MKLSRTFALSTVFSTVAASTVFAQTVAAPTLKLVTPSDGQTVFGTSVPVLVSTENFEIVDYQTNPYNKVGQGHVHLWLDDKSPTRESAVKMNKDNFTYNDVPYGDHTIVAELVNSDHTSLNPPVKTTVDFKTAPVATPAPIATSGFDKNTALVILVVVALVIAAAWWYTKEEDETPTRTSTRKPISRRRSRRRR